MDPDLLAAHACVAALSGDPKGAERLVAMLALRVTKFSATAYVALGGAVLTRGDPTGTVKALNRAMYEDLHLAITHIRKAEILAGTGRLDEIACFCQWQLATAPGGGRLHEAKDGIEVMIK